MKIARRLVNPLAALMLALPMLPTLPALAAEPSILVKYQPTGMDSAPASAAALGVSVSKLVALRLLTEFPCAVVDDDGMLPALLRREIRLWWLADDPYADSSVDHLARNYRYLAVVRATPYGGGSGAFVSMRGFNYRARVVGADVSAAVRSMGDVEPLIRKFIKQMAKMEICPYVGPVSVLIESSRSKKTEDSHGVYCNKLDQRYRKVTSHLASTNQDWKLVKTGRIETTEDSIQLSTTEGIDTTEEDDCAFCTPQRQAGQISSTETRIRARFDSLSDVTRVPGSSNHDATVLIQFTDDDQFYIALKATTKKGTRSTDTTHRTSGACSNPPPKRTRTSVEADVAIEEPRFGPFAGSPLDKRLKGKLEIPLNDPLIGETGLKKIEFDLSRK
jgi:hypothetical protein